jgi:hypothetical protein
MTPGAFDAVEVSIVRWHKDNQFGIEFLRYTQGTRERVLDLIEGREAPVNSNRPLRRNKLSALSPHKCLLP